MIEGLKRKASDSERETGKKAGRIEFTRRAGREVDGDGDGRG